jgi:hypothetical protein
MDMNKKWLTGIAAGILVTAALIAVGVGAYNAGERNATDVQVVGEVVGEDDSAVRTIVVDGHGWGWGRGGPGFFPGFVVFPLIVIGIVLLVGSRRRRWYGPPWRYDADPELDAWHRRAHGESPPDPPVPPAPPIR